MQGQMIAINNYTQYKVLETIGQGTYGVVHRGILQDSGAEVAIKVRPKMVRNKIVTDKIYREIDLHRTCSTIPYTVPLYDVVDHDDAPNVYLIMKKLRYSLHDLVKKQVKLDEMEVRQILRKVTEWLSNAHKLGVCYGDLKAQNIMMGSNGVTDVYMIDFSHSVYTPKHNEPPLHTIRGTLPYMSPQVVLRAYDHRTDLWSLGILCYYLLEHRFPIHHNKGEPVSVEQYSQKILTFSTDDLTFAPHITQDAKDFIAGLLEFSPDDRRSIDDSLEHSFLDV